MCKHLRLMPEFHPHSPRTLSLRQVERPAGPSCLLRLWKQDWATWTGGSRVLDTQVAAVYTRGPWALLVVSWEGWGCGLLQPEGQRGSFSRPRLRAVRRENEEVWF